MCILSFNQWLKFDQTSTDTSLGRGKEVIRFWWPLPYFQGHYIIKTLEVSLGALCLMNQSMEFAQTSTDTSLGSGKEVIRFWGPLFHFQGHTGFLIKKKKKKRLCAHYILNQWLEFYKTSTNASLGHGKGVIRFWWPWPYFQGHYIIKTLEVSLGALDLMNQ